MQCPSNGAVSGSVSELLAKKVNNPFAKKQKLDLNPEDDESSDSNEKAMRALQAELEEGGDIVMRESKSPPKQASGKASLRKTNQIRNISDVDDSDEGSSSDNNQRDESNNPHYIRQ